MPKSDEEEHHWTLTGENSEAIVYGLGEEGYGIEEENAGRIQQNYKKEKQAS